MLGPPSASLHKMDEDARIMALGAYWGTRLPYIRKGLNLGVDAVKYYGMYKGGKFLLNKNKKKRMSWFPSKSYQAKHRRFNKGLKKAWRRATTTNGTKALRMVKKLNAGIETKQVTMSPTGGITAGVAHITLLNGLVKGTDDDDRVGDKISMKSLAMRYSFASHTAETNGYQIRSVLVYDRSPRGSTISWDDVFDNVSVYAAVDRKNNKGRFKIMMDQTTILDAYTTNKDLAVRKKWFNLKGAPAIYARGNSGFAGDFSKGAIYFMHLSAGNTQVITHVGAYRMLYKDM